MYRRQSAVSGIFYPSSESVLTLTVQNYLQDTASSPAIGIVSPHAGYDYSGLVAGTVYSAVDVPPTVLLLGPNHRISFNELYGMALVFPSGCFVTPLGEVRIDEALAEQLLAGGDIIVEDVNSHRLEHSLEVQLPFLQMRRRDVRIVPVLMNMGYNENHLALHNSCKVLGDIISSAISSYEGDVLIVASSDMNHRESREVTRVKDEKALGRITDLDVAGFLEVTEEENITVCGKVGIAAMMEASLRLGASEVKVIMYRDSGDVTGDFNDVVGYAGIVIR